MRIVADQDIPFVTNYFSHAGELILKNGRKLENQDLRDADVLLVRSVTKVDANLLANTKVKFVGTLTTGTNHVDTNWLEQNGIAWASSYGFNAKPVVEYMISLIALLQKIGIFVPQKNYRAGIIGLGNIGSMVRDKLQLLGFDTICCDPPRAEQDSNFESHSLDEFENLDLITIHTPLTEDGKYPTHNLINKNFLRRQKKNCVLVNTGRGAVINFSDLLEYGHLLYWCLDVWPTEPYINFDVLKAALIATPHMAGYSAQSKLRGTAIIYKKLLEQKIISEAPNLNLPIASTQQIQANSWQDAVLQVFDPSAATFRMREAILEDNSQATFDALRKYFFMRNEFANVQINLTSEVESDFEMLKNLGFKLNISQPLLA